MTLALDNPDQILALGYAKGVENRRLMATAFAFDALIGGQVLSAREAVFAQLRLSWWREQLQGLGAGTALPNDPLLAEIAALVRNDVKVEPWVAIVDGWEFLLTEGPATEDELAAFAQGRGRGVFGVIPHGNLSTIGEGWALADLAVRTSDVKTAERMMDMALPRLAVLRQVPALGETRTLRVLAALALRDVQAGLAKRLRPGSPRRALGALRYALAHW